jgi:parvulin-like peptidyl-prolyl isomerase
MSQVLHISSDEILHQIKLSCQIPSVIQAIMVRHIIRYVAQQQGIKVEPEELQLAADEFRFNNNLKSAEYTWSWLQKHHLSLDNLEELVEITVISSKLAQHLFADKVESFFIEHQLDYVKAGVYEVILEDIDIAMELFYAIEAQEISFYEVARQYIQDIDLQRRAGYRGLLGRMDLKPNIASVVFAATPPEIIKPIMTAQGIHLILVEELIQPKLGENLSYEILSNLFSTWLNEQVQKFEVSVINQ